jgi:CheY-like chemotaxis protein
MKIILKEGEMKRILLVNDSKELLELMGTLLKAQGYEPLLRSYPILNLNMIIALRPDLIILDIMFGNQQAIGWSMLDLLKLSPSTASIPVIVCTAALKEVFEQQDYLAAQGVRVLFKPFVVEAMLDAIQSALASVDG